MGGTETMTKKYTWEVCEGDGLFYEDGAGIDYDDVVDLLNEQDQQIKQLKKENRLLDIEDERWVKASEQDEETINKLNKEIEKLTHELYLEKGSAEYYKQLAEEYFEEISKLTYKLNKIKDDIER